MNSIPVDVKIHPTVLFSIVDSYERRNEKMKRVVGTLLGTNIQGNIEVTDCFVVPHRDGDEVDLKTLLKFLSFFFTFNFL
jgi:translation initiation factor 3 subunit F